MCEPDYFSRKDGLACFKIWLLFRSLNQAYFLNTIIFLKSWGVQTAVFQIMDRSSHLTFFRIDFVIWMGLKT